MTTWLEELSKVGIDLTDRLDNPCGYGYLCSPHVALSLKSDRPTDQEVDEIIALAEAIRDHFEFPVRSDGKLVGHIAATHILYKKGAEWRYKKSTWTVGDEWANIEPTLSAIREHILK